MTYPLKRVKYFLYIYRCNISTIAPGHRDGLCLTLLLMKPAAFLICLTVIACECALSMALASTPASDAFAGSTQLIAVTSADWNSVEGRLQRFERANVHEMWRPVGDPIPIVLGKNGLGWGIGVVAIEGSGVRAADEPIKKEGDGKSPAGIFALGTAFGYAAQPLPKIKLPYLTLTPSIECVDDIQSKHYNQVLDRSSVVPDWNSSEHMRNAGESYRWGIVVDHNGTVVGRNSKPPVPGGGSCVFLHIWQSHTQGTAGCTAMEQPNLEILLTWLDPARKPLLVQLPVRTYQRLSHLWRLPKLTNVSSP
jgi:L,D-peptidoglycan transpeptidase YkuD (ErfK/YbiS/YcfS/YnhG family)